MEIRTARFELHEAFAVLHDEGTRPYERTILEDAAFTTIARELGRPIGVEDVKPHAAAALADVFDLAFVESEDGEGRTHGPAFAVGSDAVRG